MGRRKRSRVTERRTYGSPVGRREAGHRLDPTGHVGLVGKTRFGRNRTEWVAGAGDAEPGVPGAKFGAEHLRRNSVGLGKTAGDRFGCQAIGFGPGGEFKRRVAAQTSSEKIGPVIFSVRRGDPAFAEPFAKHRRREVHILFGGASDRIHIIDAI